MNNLNYPYQITYKTKTNNITLSNWRGFLYRLHHFSIRKDNVAKLQSCYSKRIREVGQGSKKFNIDDERKTHRPIRIDRYIATTQRRLTYMRTNLYYTWERTLPISYLNGQQNIDNALNSFYNYPAGLKNKTKTIRRLNKHPISEHTEHPTLFRNIAQSNITLAERYQHLLKIETVNIHDFHQHGATKFKSYSKYLQKLYSADGSYNE